MTHTMEGRASFPLSEPIEALLREHDVPLAQLEADHSAQSHLPVEVDFLVVGSGYGAAMAALALAERATESGAKPSIWVFERGKEYTPNDFPRTMQDVPAYVDFISDAQAGNAANLRNRGGLFEIRAGDGVSILSGSGLGGTSLINANVAARPAKAVLDRWPTRLQEQGSWAEKFEQVYSKIEALLGVTTTPGAKDFSKYQALARTAVGLKGEVAPAPVSINFDGRGPHSVDTGACNMCGNCVIGCHSGAKQSLNLNAWPLFRQLGGSQARVYTGASVQFLEHPDGDGSPWEVHCALTRDLGKTFSVRARKVILAAGTIGSVEILKRSESKRNLSLSARLGQQFSTNGDGLISSVGQLRPVEAIADIPGRQSPRKQPGPTIIGKAKIGLGDARYPQDTFTLEEGAIPFPLVSLWQEIITTQSFFKRFAERRKSAWHTLNKDRHDYLCTSSDLNEHSQVLLVMGDDRARGWLDYDKERDTALPGWKTKPGKEKQEQEWDFFEALDKRLVRADKKSPGDCFDGGQYHPNILWKLLPEGFADAVEGADDLPKNLLSVHPIGGCCMGESPESGVVNLAGAVYKGDGSGDVHEGLYVLDGAILPGAVGTNPYMTIAAASYLLAHELAVGSLPDGPALDATFPELDKTAWHLEDRDPAYPAEDPAPVQGVFREHLVHFIGPRNLMPWSRRGELTVAELNRLLPPGKALPEDTRSLVLEIKFELGGSQHLEAWTRSPDQPLPAEATLSYDAHGSTQSKADAELVEIAQLKGTVNLGAVNKPYFAWWRALTRVFCRFLRFRRNDLGSMGSGGIRKLLKSVVNSIRIALLHADFREMHYSFQADPSDAAASAAGLSFEGTKQIAYDIRQHSIWGSLMSVPAVLSGNGEGAELPWEVDAVGITRGPAPLQVGNSLDLVHVLTSLGGVMALYFRLFLQTHFWSFGAADYKKYKTLEEMCHDSPEGRMEPPPERMPFRDSETRESQPVEIHEYDCDDAGKRKQTARLIRYQPPDGSGFDLANRKALLLVHGLAHSSRIFWSEAPIKLDDGETNEPGKNNFVQYFLARNYDVWILDHRTSANYVEKVTPEDRWDHIAKKDVPWAVKKVFDCINGDKTGERKKVHVFSHCIGAGAVAIAVLDKKLRDTEGNTMLASLVPHAVAPWLFASVANRARENIWALFKNMEPLEIVEPCPHENTPLVENIFDRIALSTLDKYENAQWDHDIIKNDKRGPMFPRTTYARYTIIWGRQWHIENINKTTRNDFGGMIGAVPRDVLQQVYSSIVRGLLSNHDGNNVYVTRKRIESQWTFPTLFIHGDQNTVFDMESSRKSAEMLTRHRKFKKMSRFWDPISPQDYCENDVWIEILPDYGHMDMVLGAQASLDGQVFDKLHRFFEAADRGDMAGEYCNDASTPQEKSAFRRERGAQSRIGPTRRPLTGPIISHPRAGKDGKVELSLWVEAQDFSSIPVQEVLVKTGSVDPARNVPRTRNKFRKLPGWQHIDDVFWLTRYEFEPAPGGGEDALRRLWLDYGRGNKVPPGAVTLEWENLDWLARLRDPDSVDSQEPGLSFLLGSCLYPGTMFDREQMESIFDGMYQHVLRASSQGPHGADRRGVDHVLLLGDQIYADATANLMDPITGYEKYRVRYRKAFGNEPARKLLSHVPSYFTVDDHEYSDNFQGFKKVDRDREDAEQKKARKKARKEFKYAREMAAHYLVHSRSAWTGKHPRLWHRFASADYPFFVFDTRFERKATWKYDRDDPRSLVSDRQLQAFEDWVSTAEGRVLFVGTGSSFAPVTCAEAKEPGLLQGGDTLLSYPGFLARVVEILRKHAADKHVCWLSGDPHLSCYAGLVLEDASTGSAAITHICASGLYAPVSFINTNPRLCDWGSGTQVLPLGKTLNLHFEQHLLCSSHQHFLRLDLRDQKGSVPVITLGSYDAAGKPLAPPSEFALQRVCDG